MKHLVSFTLLFSAVCALSLCKPDKYHFVNESKTWYEAQKYCRQNISDLASISNMEDMNNLTEILKGKTTGMIWIGLQREESREWSWARKHDKKHKDHNWCKNTPNQKSLTEVCAQMMKDGCWTDQDCVTANNFVCYDAKNNEKFILIKEKKSWCDARKHCRERYTDLASVKKPGDKNKDKSDESEIKNKIEAKHFPVWIGLFSTSWNWSDGSDSCFRNWELKQPNLGTEKCVALTMTSSGPEGKWHDQNCTDVLPFICNNGTNVSNQSEADENLILIKKNLTWEEALIYCRTNHSDLVSVETDEVQSWVKEVASRASTAHVWLGLRYTCLLRFWYWVNGESVCYDNWAPGNGTQLEDCGDGGRSGAVEFGGNYSWISLKESLRLNFICTK